MTPPAEPRRAPLPRKRVRKITGGRVPARHDSWPPAQNIKKSDGRVPAPHESCPSAQQGPSSAHSHQPLLPPPPFTPRLPRSAAPPAESVRARIRHRPLLPPLPLFPCLPLTSAPPGCVCAGTTPYARAAFNAAELLVRHPRAPPQALRRVPVCGVAAADRATAVRQRLPAC